MVTAVKRMRDPQNRRARHVYARAAEVGQFSRAARLRNRHTRGARTETCGTDTERRSIIGGGVGGLTSSQDSSDKVFTRMWPCESPDSGAGGQLSITLNSRTTHTTGATEGRRGRRGRFSIAQKTTTQPSGSTRKLLPLSVRWEKIVTPSPVFATSSAYGSRAGAMQTLSLNNHALKALEDCNKPRIPKRPSLPPCRNLVAIRVCQPPLER